MDDDVWYAIRNTPKVSGFVGGAKPSPLLDAEVDAILKQMKETAERPQPKVLFEPGENVRIIDGPFSNFIGVSGHIYPEQENSRLWSQFSGDPRQWNSNLARSKKAKTEKNEELRMVN